MLIVRWERTYVNSVEEGAIAFTWQAVSRTNHTAVPTDSEPNQVVRAAVLLKPLSNHNTLPAMPAYKRNHRGEPGKYVWHAAYGTSGITDLGYRCKLREAFSDFHCWNCLEEQTAFIAHQVRLAPTITGANATATLWISRICVRNDRIVGQSRHKASLSAMRVPERDCRVSCRGRKISPRGAFCWGSLLSAWTFQGPRIARQSDQKSTGLIATCRRLPPICLISSSRCPTTLSPSLRNWMCASAF